VTAGRLAAVGAWVSRQRHATIPDGARRAARVQLANMVAAAYASTRDAGVTPMLAGLPCGAGPSTVLATGRRTSPAEAAFINAAYSMAQDFDDIIWMGHTCHSAVFASLAVAEAERRDGEALVTAIVVANEVAGRLGASCFLGPLNGQMWTFVHLIGAAAATASLLGLDATQTAHALAISLAQPPFALQPGFFTPTSKYLAASIPTQIGVQAAYLARAGMTGPLDVLENPRGFWARFSFLPLPAMLDGLGELWLIETLTIKTVPACHYFQTACEALDVLRARRPLHDPDAVRTITAFTTKLGSEVTRFAREEGAPHLTPVGAAFDLALTLAIALHAGGHAGEHADTAWLQSQRGALEAWYRKITVVHDPMLTARVLDSARGLAAVRAALAALTPRRLLGLIRDYRASYRSELFDLRELRRWTHAIRSMWRHPAPSTANGALPLYFPNRIEVTFADGTRDAAQIDLPAGSLAAPTLDAALRAKFLTEVSPVLGAERAEAGLAAALAADRLPIDELIAALRV
jgi:2-methylcitrate dehydratase PrpD